MQKDEKLVQKRKGQKNFLTRRSYLSYIYNFFKTTTFSINTKKEKGKYIKNRKKYHRSPWYTRDGKEEWK